MFLYAFFISFSSSRSERAKECEALVSGLVGAHEVWLTRWKIARYRRFGKPQRIQEEAQ